MTLDNPLRLETQKRLTAILETVSFDYDGTTYDLDGDVHRGRLYYGDETPVPSISILEVPIPLDQLPPPDGSVASSGGYELMIQGWAPDDRDNPTDPAHFFMAEVKKALAIERKKAHWDRPEDGILGLGRRVDNLYIGAGVVRPPDEVSSKAYFWLTITLELVEDLEEPYEEV
tara:strand:- start:15057 stop:15575 length:519 start_codon:yes stop_codon:yes gene_type:complete